MADTAARVATLQRVTGELSQLRRVPLLSSSLSSSSAADNLLRCWVLRLRDSDRSRSSMAAAASNAIVDEALSMLVASW